MPHDVIDVPLPAAPAAPVAQHIETHIRHDSTVRELVPVHLRYLALTLLTVGLYHFWARTYVRRLLWHRTRLLGDPFVYIGRPVELLAGFAVALVLLIAPFLYLNYVLLPPVLLDPEAESAAGWILAAGSAQAVVVPYLIFVGSYSARRYQLSRTVWRGIRFAQSGSAWRYGLRGVGFAALSVLTAGFFYPWQRSKLARRRIGNTSFGGQAFACDIRGGQLVKPFLILWLGGVLIYLPIVAMGTALAIAQAEGKTTGDMQTAIQVFGYVAYAVLVLLYLTYRACEQRHIARLTRMGDLRFEFSYTVWQYLRYAIGNILVLLVTLSTGWIYVRRRQLRFLERHLTIVGAVDLASLRATEARGPRTGEGLAEVLDIGFDIGF